MTAAETLRAAAERLRATAQAATAGPWKVDSSIPYGHRVGSADDADWVAWTGEHGETQSPEDAAYIALMQPGLGLALARWLDQAADAFEGQECPDGEPALKVARLVLGVDCPGTRKEAHDA